MKIGPGQLICFIGIWIWSGLLAGQEIQMVLPVKYRDNNLGMIKPLLRDFELIINGIPRPILDLIEYRDVLKEPGVLKRNFVLSFHINEYNQRIAGAVAHFVYQILQPGDHLIVLSPIKSHSIAIGSNKEKVILDIEKLLIPEFESFRKHQITAEKKLKTLINKLNQVIRDDSRSSGYDVQRFKDINMFLNIYPQEMEKYCQTYLIPRVEKYDRILKLFSGRGGTRWWIHFHQRESGDLLAATRRIINRINEYFKDYVTHFSRLISNLENALNLSESFPTQRLRSSLVGENVCYNVICFGGVKNSQREIRLANSSDLIKKMADISRSCGGRSVVSVDPKNGIREIEKHVYSFWELVYGFNGRVESKSFNVNWRYKNELVYKEASTAEEIKSRIKFLQNKKVTIGDLVLTRERASFSISRFRHDAQHQVGILKVQICLKDSQGKVRYRKEKILRATQNRVNLSLELPDTGENRLNLEIMVIDLIGNNRALFKQAVRL